MSPITDITVHELERRLSENDKPVVLDCREPAEWQFCRLEGAVHIPMHALEKRVGELDASSDIVVYCHHGIRSKAVAEFLHRSGFPRVLNLAGGIDAWSLYVDADVPRY